MPAAAMTGGLILGRSCAGRQRPGFLSDAEEGGDALVTYAGDAHLLTIAPTGAGKGVGCVIPNALLYPGPLIVFDPKGEVYAVTKRRREELGQKVVLLDVFGTTGQPADALNPLDLAGLIDPGRPEDAAASLATLLTGGQLSHKDPFWDITAQAFITGLLTWLLTDCPPEERCFSRLYDLFSDSDLAYRLSGMLDSGEIRHPAAIAEIAAFLNHPERETRPSVQSTARQHLPLFGSGVVRTATDRTSFDLGDLVEGRPLSLFIVVPPNKLVSHRPLLRLWLGTLILALAARTRLPAQRTLMLMDEAAQLEATYGGEAMVLVDNAGVVQLFAARNGRMAEAYARLLGDVSPEGVMALGRDEQLLLLEGGRSFRSRRINYLHDPLCAGLFDPHPGRPPQEAVLE
ncbi:MAG: type IV secretory system conjugative DNA transfer family protein [Rhodospirillales bacterium]|nr:type IV secretory system conjugative DNA transfer family protein [Rhodospirillales bacterium]